jgi:preprotein translocase subunit SecA
LKGSDDDIEKELNRIGASNDHFVEVVGQKKEQLGEEEFYAVTRRLMLQTIDLLWVEHLQVMDYMRSSVNLRAYGQRDPLVEYKKEGLQLFRELQESVDDHVARLVEGIGAGAFKVSQDELKRVQQSARQASEQSSGEVVQKTVVNKEKVGRNDPCPCGSGKKYKKCHGA